MSKVYDRFLGRVCGIIDFFSSVDTAGIDPRGILNSPPGMFSVVTVASLFISIGKIDRA